MSPQELLSRNGEPSQRAVVQHTRINLVQTHSLSEQEKQAIMNKAKMFKIQMKAGLAKK